jgi:hypothetical protein
MSDPRKDPNYLFKIRLRRGEAPLRILLSKIQKQVSDDQILRSKKRRHEGPLESSKKEDDPIIQRKQGITFYDMGRKWNGSAFVDIDYTVPTVYNKDGTSNAGFALTPMTLTNYRSMESFIIDYSMDQLEQMHPKISQEQGAYSNFKTGPEFAGLGTLWKSGKLMATQAQLDAVADFSVGYGVGPSVYFYQAVKLRGTGRYKLTNSYDPAATDVGPLNPKVGDKIFLMPALNAPVNGTQFYDYVDNYGFGDHVIGDVRQYEGYKFCIVPKVQLYDSSSPYYQLAINASTWSVLGVTGFLTQYLFSWKRVQWLQSWGIIQDTWYNAHEAFVGYVWNPTSDPFPNSFFSPTAEPVVGSSQQWAIGQQMYSDSGTHDAAHFNGGGGNAIPTGVLVAIVKRGSQLFYVWR